MDVTQVTESEKQLLSALMLRDGEAMAEVVEVLKAEDFYRSEHRLIYSAILRLYAADIALNAFVVRNELEKEGTLNRVTWKYLSSLTELEYTMARVSYYAERIKTAARLRRLAQIGRELADSATKSDAEVTEILAETERNLTAAVTDSFRKIVSAADLAQELCKDIAAPRDGMPGVPTGFRYLDKLICGLKKTDLIILAARPSMGKTALAMNIAANAARKHVVMIFSLEMSRLQIGQRICSAASRVNAMRIQNQKLTDGELTAVAQACGTISDLKFFIDDSRGITLAEIRIKAQRLKRERGLDLIVIDYLQLIQCGERYRGNRVQEVSELSRGLKILAQELDVPVLVLSQLSRAVEQRADKRPQLSDLRESGSIEQDADVVMLLYREEYYNHEDAENIAEVIIAKNRNGMTGSVPLKFEKEYMCFSNLTRRADD